MIAFFKRLVTHNLGLKLVSLTTATLLWLAVARNPLTEVAVTVPIEFHHVPGDLEISSERIPQVQIRVRGPERLVRGLDQDGVHATIDLAGATPGERTYSVSGNQIHVPHGVEVVQVVPSQLRIGFDKPATREVEVRPRVIGSIAPGLQIASVKADPAQIQITGPARHVNAIDSALTDPVDATGVVGQATFMTHVYVPDPLVHITRQEEVHVIVITGKGVDHEQRGVPPSRHH